jgi:hypothetical protein
MCLVKESQPAFAWLPGRESSTVRIEFINKTPWLAHGNKFPETKEIPKSVCNSLSIFFNEGGNTTPYGTEKHNPFA